MSAPFRIALIGDFSGRANRGVCSTPRAVEIDPGNFEDVMERMGVALNFPGIASLPFRELDDFHPDHLYATLPLFEAVRSLKAELSKPAAANKPPAPPAASKPVSIPLSGGSLLDQIAEAAAPAPAPVAEPLSARDESAWNQAVQSIAARYAQPAEDPRRKEMAATVDETAAAQMRAILHHPDFQTIESAWRSVFFLMQQLETGMDLKIYLVDFSRAEFVQSPEALHKIFQRDAAGEESWSLLAGLYTFSATPQDCSALAAFGGIAGGAGAPFLAGIDASLFGCASIAATPDPDDWKEPVPPESARAWKQLCESADADWIGLAMPRFLLRLPYGKKTSPVDSFDFEEMPRRAHEDYLWGNGAVAVACMIAQGGEPGAVNRMCGMPVHIYSPGEATPQAEIWMTERLAGRVASQGVMPLASVKNSDMIQAVRFQAISGQPLAGAW